MTISVLQYKAGTTYKPDFQIGFDFGANLGRLLCSETRSEIKRFVGFLVQHLDIDATTSKYDQLNVMFKRPRLGDDNEGLDGKFIDGETQGTVWVFVRDVINRVADFRAVLEAIAHEMVHVKQFCDKKLAKIFTRHEGEVVGCYSWSDGANLIYLDSDVSSMYEDLPWEREAFGLQSKLVNDYEEFLKAKGKTTLLYQPERL